MTCKQRPHFGLAQHPDRYVDTCWGHCSCMYIRRLEGDTRATASSHQREVFWDGLCDSRRESSTPPPRPVPPHPVSLFPERTRVAAIVARGLCWRHQKQGWQGEAYLTVQWRTETSTGNLTRCYGYVRDRVEEHRLRAGFGRGQVFFNTDLPAHTSGTYAAEVCPERVGGFRNRSPPVGAFVLGHACTGADAILSV